MILIGMFLIGIAWGSPPRREPCLNKVFIQTRKESVIGRLLRPFHNVIYWILVLDWSFHAHSEAGRSNPGLAIT